MRPTDLCRCLRSLRSQSCAAPPSTPMRQRIGPLPHPHPPPLRQLLGRARRSVLAGATPARPRRTTPSTPARPSSPAPAQASPPIGHNYPVARGAFLLQHAPTADAPRRDVPAATMPTDSPRSRAADSRRADGARLRRYPPTLHHLTLNKRAPNLLELMLITRNIINRAPHHTHPPSTTPLLTCPTISPFAAPLTVSPFVFVACLRIRYAYERACLMHEWPMAYIQWS